MSNTTIIIEEYSPAWASLFQQLRAVYLTQLGDLITEVEHVGSTSVPGLAAKPIIDIDLILRSKDDLGPVIGKLRSLGYEHQGDLGIQGREAFKRLSDQVPFDAHTQTWPKHHLYACPADSIALKNHLALRDFLRSDPAKATAYAELKRNLAFANPYDMDRYVEGKTAFIVEVLGKVGFDPHTLDRITQQNRMDNLKTNR